MPIKEFYYDKILEGFEMDKNQFIDLCILLGCDYCDKIRGIGPKNAIKLIQEHKSIEKILENIRVVDGLLMCALCGKTAKQKAKGDLKRHVETHIEGLSFPCNHCGKLFTTRNSLHHHVSTYHKKLIQYIIDSEYDVLQVSFQP